MRVIGADGEQVGVLSRDEALNMAEDIGMDLVEIQPTADPPVCRIMDFGKFKFEQQKKAHAAKRKTKQVEIKELKFRPTTEDGDYDVKMRNLRRFLEEGDKVKITIRFKGREMAHTELGEAMVKRIQARCRRRSGDRKFPALRRSPDGDDDRAEEEVIVARSARPTVPPLHAAWERAKGEGERR